MLKYPKLQSQDAGTGNKNFSGQQELLGLVQDRKWWPTFILSPTEVDESKVRVHEWSCGSSVG